MKRSPARLTGFTDVALAQRASYDQYLNIYIGFKALKDNPALLPSNPRDKVDFLKFIEGLEKIAEPFLQEYASHNYIIYTPGTFGSNVDDEGNIHKLWEYITSTNPLPEKGKRATILWRLIKTEGVCNELCRLLMVVASGESIDQARLMTKIDLKTAPEAWKTKLAEIEAAGRVRS